MDGELWYHLIVFSSFNSLIINVLIKGLEEENMHSHITYYNPLVNKNLFSG